jgi:hypothetical protein
MGVFFWLLLGFFFKMGYIFFISIISHVSLVQDVRESMALGYGIYLLDITWETKCSCEELLMVVVEGEKAQ